VIVVGDIDREAFEAETPRDDEPRSVTGASVSVRVACDSDLLGSGPAIWWHQWIERLPAVLKSVGVALDVNKPIVAFDEASGRRVTIGATQ
jgi:hypothetical protein